MTEQLAMALAAARAAGAAILAHYRQPLTVDTKDDGSPLTAADRAAHLAITAILDGSGIACVSEEGSDLLLNERTYWLVDPLDGTKDFLAANDEFTVNVALVVDQEPVLGVVYAPALDELYAGQRGAGAWYERAGVRQQCRALARAPACRMAVSRFHDHPDVARFARDNGIEQRVAHGAALKYGRLACAALDVFPRLVGCSEWDTGAGQAVLEAAGGQVLDWDTGLPLRYGKPGRRNPRLLSLRAPYRYADFKLASYAEPLP